MAKNPHPGFAGAAKSIERKEGVSESSAKKILGYGKAHASPAAKKANPRLNNTPGKVRDSDSDGM